MRDIERHSCMLAETSTKEYYRVYTHICSAVQNFVKNQVDAAVAEMDFYLSLRHKVRIRLIVLRCF